MGDKKKKFKAKTLRKKQAAGLAKKMGQVWKKTSKAKKRERFVRNKDQDITQAVKDFNAYDFLCRQQEAKEWIEGCTGEQMEGSIVYFMDWLHDGVILCKLANCFEPGAVPKIYTNTKLEFQHTENIRFFLDACLDVGLPRLYLFSIPDLWERKNILNVIHCLHSLARYLESVGKAPKLQNLSGKVTFTEEEMSHAEEELKKYEETSIPMPEGDADEGEDDEADPDECTVEGDGISPDGVRAGKPVAFIIQARDNLGNTIDTGGEDFTATITNNESGNVTHVEVKDLQNGQYEGHYMVKEAGPSTLDIRVMDIQIKGSPFPVNVADTGKTEPTKCVAVGERSENAVAGSEASFLVQANDRYGNNRSVGGEEVTAALKNKSTGTDVPVSVEDLEDGTYRVLYTCSESGDHEMEIKMNNKTISGSPLNIVVKDAGISDLSKSSISDLQESGEAGEEVHFTIVARDKHGNARESGGEDFNGFLVNTETGEKIEGSVTDLNNGTYSVSTIVDKTGSYAPLATLNEQKIESDDKTVVSASKEVEPEQCTIENIDDIKNVKAGDETTFILQSRDRYGNAVDIGGGKYRVTMNHTKENNIEVPVEVVDLENGQYRVEFTPEIAGDYSIAVEAGKEIVNEVEDIEFADDDDDDLRSDEGSSSMMSPREGTSSDKPTTEGTTEPATEDLTDEAKSEDLMSASELYTVKKRKITKIEYSPVANSPVQITVTDADETDPAKSTVDGDGLFNSVSGRESQFRIASRDRFGNIRSRGGDQYSAKFVHLKTQQEFDAPVEDLGNGYYDVKFRPQEWGSYKAKVSLNGVQLGALDDEEDLLAFEVSRPVDVRGLSLDEVVKLSSFDLMKSLKADAEVDEESLILEIQSLKRDVVLQIRQNNVREQNVKKLDRKIELLISNRVTLQEVLKDSGGFFRRLRRRNTRKAEGSELSQQDKVKMELYANLFYLLQTEPRYLARIVYLVSPDKVDSFLQTVILTLYGYAFSPREEFLLLSLFKQTLEQEIGMTNTVGGFLEENPIITKMVMAYCRRDQGKIFTKDILFEKLITPIVDDPELDLEINPTKTLKAIITEEEIQTGVKSNLSLKNMTDEEAMQNEQVRDIINLHLKQLESACQSFLDGIAENVDELPYGLRWVCKQLYSILKLKFEDSTESSIEAVIGNFVYSRFMNPIICAPDAFQLTKKLFNNKTRRNLLLIAKVLQTMFHRQEFNASGAEKSMTMMNGFIQANKEKLGDLFKSIITIEDPEEKLQYTKFSEFTATTRPVISISPNEIFRTHKVLIDNKDKLGEPEDHLIKVLDQLGDVPQQIPEEDNDEINLTLQNAFEADIERSELNSQQTYEETKELLRRILKHVPAEKFGETLGETMANAEAYTKAGILSAELSKQLQAEIEQVKENLESLKSEGQDTNESFRQIILDMAKDAHMRNRMREMQRKEIERLKRSLVDLKQHSKYLKEQFESYQKYLEDARQKQDVGNKKKKKDKKKKKKDKKKVFKFSYSQLVKKGVIVNLDLPKTQARSLKFFLSSETGGVFEVEARVAGLHVKTIQLEIDDLLEKRYNGQDTIAVEGLITLDVNMTLHVINKLFTL